MALSTQVHRPSALKQQNKRHNKLGHKTKGQVNAQYRGRVSIKNLSKILKKDLSKEQRRHQLKQIRSHKREEAIFKKRQLGTSYAPPFLITVVPLSHDINPRNILKNLTDCDDSTVSKFSDQGILHLSCSRLKQRFSFVVPPVGDLYAILDSAKVSDTILFVWKVGEEINDSTKLLLSSLKSQGLPAAVHGIVGEEDLSSKNYVPEDLEGVLKSSLVISDQPPFKSHKKMRVLKDLQLEISSQFPDHSRPFYLNKVQDVNLILRQIGSQKQRSVFYRDQRSHMIAEKVSFEGEGSSGTLKIHGYVRSQPFSVNSLIHIPGWGEFQIAQIDSQFDPFPLDLNKRSRSKQDLGEVEEPKVLDLPNPKHQQTLQSTCDVDPMEEEQTWPTEEEIQNAVVEHALKKKKKLPRGTSEYQACWTEDTDDEEDSLSEACSETSSKMDDFNPDFFAPAVPSTEESGDEHQDDDIEDDRTTLTSAADDYDNKMDYKEEMSFLEKMRAAKEDAAFPDEIDTPIDIPTRVRFQKYRGLQSFRTSPWDKNESLPLDYKRILHFRNFDHTKKRIFKMERDGAMPGWFIIVHLKDVPKHLYIDHMRSQSPLAVYSLLPHEQKMSVLNLLLKSHPTTHLRPIKSKERLVFHVGFRRFANAPIFSENTLGDKHKFVRYFHPGEIVVASMFGPVTFPPCPVSVFRERSDGAHELIASGSVLSANPDRIVCKRVVLSGHPFKLFTICAFATTTNFLSYLKIGIMCDSVKDVIAVPLYYNFKLYELNLRACNGTKSLIFRQDFSSDSSFFVTVGVLAFLFVLGALIFYTFCDKLYSQDAKIPTIDFAFHCIFSILYLAGSSAWANSLNGLKTATTIETIQAENAQLCSGSCELIAEPNFSKLNISVILGFLNVFLFASNLWFIYKETVCFMRKEDEVKAAENEPRV